MKNKQRKHLEDLLIKDFPKMLNANPLFIRRPHIIPSGRHSKVTSIDEATRIVQQSQNRRAEKAKELSMDKIESLFSKDELFKFAYVPFVIAELVWDYADTVINLAGSLHYHAALKLSRAIRQARKEYERERWRYIDRERREREIDNGYVFEDAVERITSQLVLNLKIDINSAYPQLSADARHLVVATYQCHILSKALLKYMDRQTALIASKVKHPIGRMLPNSYYIMDALILEFAGDKPVSQNFNTLLSRYVDTLAAQISLVKLNDITN